MPRTSAGGACRVALVALSFVTGTARAQDDAVEPGGVRAPVVTVVEAVRGEIADRVPVSGTLVAAEEVVVNTRVDGYAIETIAVEIGDRVEAGDVLATLDDAGATAALAQAEAELARSDAAIGQAEGQVDAAAAAQREAATSLQRTTRLGESGGVSRSSLDQATAAAESARANLASARRGLDVAKAQRAAAESQRNLAKLTLERTRIRAPVAGLVSARNAQLGEIAGVGAEPLFRLIRGGELEVAVDVAETELGGVDVGDTATLNVAGVGTVAGHVRLVAPTVDARSRLGSVRIALPDVRALRAGLSASGWLVTGRREAITVPSTAVLNRDGVSSVQLVADESVETRPVVPGTLSADGRREIVRGLDGGESVIARAGAFYADGDAVRPVPASLPDADVTAGAGGMDGTTGAGGAEVLR